MGDYFSAEGYAMLDNENFLSRYYTFAIFHFKNLFNESSSCSFYLPGNSLLRSH